MAMVMAKLYTDRPNVVTQRFSYHGWTQGAAATTGLARAGAPTGRGTGRRDPGPCPAYPPPEYHEAAGADALSGHAAGSASMGSCRASPRPRRLIRELGPETVAAFISDVSQGPGIHPPPEYVPQVREMCDRLGVLWIDDEVLTGFGRMGRWFGYQAYPGVKPDIMALGKGLVGAAVPAAAVVGRTGRSRTSSGRGGGGTGSRWRRIRSRWRRSWRRSRRGSRKRASWSTPPRSVSTSESSCGRARATASLGRLGRRRRPVLGDRARPRQGSQRGALRARGPRGHGRGRARRVARGERHRRTLPRAGRLRRRVRAEHAAHRPAAGTSAERECDEFVAALDAALSELDGLCS